MTWRIAPMLQKVRPVVATVIALVPVALPARAQMMAIPLFDQHCASCHSAPAPGSRAPDRTGLGQRTPEAILDAMTTGAMAVNATGMTEPQKRSLAEALAGRPLGALAAGQASAMKNHCASRPLGDPARGPMWSGWGPDATNARLQAQPAGGLTSSQVPKLTLKWAFAFPNGSSAWGQPGVAAGRVFVGSDNGFVYSLDASSGCVYWSYEAQAGVRTAVSIGPLGGSRYAIYFGDIKGNVYAVDAESGSLVWTRHPDSHPLARITGAPTLADGRLYVPLASLEEVTGGNVNYECCTFRGGLVSYDAKTGAEIWKVSTIADPAKPTRKNAQGTQLWGPAGAAVWSAPTVDLKRGAVYVGTGDSYTFPAPDTTDSVMAFDIKTGQRLWSKQVTTGDAFLVNCGGNTAARPNCPDVSGPDVDFGNSPILRTLPGGKDVIVVGQKSGDVWAFDPDNKGAIVWQKKVGRGSAGGGLEWGSAADDQVGYFPLADAPFGPTQAGVLVALKLATGDEVWKLSPSPAANCTPGARNCVAARSAAISVIPGVLFSGTTDGVIHAYATADGQQLWEYNTAHEYTTINGVTGKGGSINGPGPVIAGGMLFTNSGYGYTNAAGGGNVLLAFGVE